MSLLGNKVDANFQSFGEPKGTYEFEFVELIQEYRGTQWLSKSPCVPLPFYIGVDIIAKTHFPMYNIVRRKELFL